MRILRNRFWRIRLITVAAILTSAIFLAPWYWNASWDVEGTKLHTAWSVSDSDADAGDYSAHIRVTVPRGADVRVKSSLPNEKVKLSYSKKLECEENSIQATVEYKIRARGKADGSEASVWVYAVDDIGNVATLELDDVRLNKRFRTDIEIPVAGTPSCYYGDS